MTDRSNSHIRLNRGVLAQVERRALEWIARRLPEAITPDLLSALGLVSMACTGLAFASFQWADRAAAAGVVAALIANWVGDSLDGTVARVRGIERPRYGYYVDHVIDLTGTAFLFTGLAYSGLMNPLLAVALFSAYLLVSAEMYLATHSTGVFRMSCFGIGATELRLLLAAGAVKAAGGASVVIGGLGSVKLFDAAATIGIGGLAAAFIVMAIGNAHALYLAEPVQRRATPGGPEGPHYDRSRNHHPSEPSAPSVIEPSHRDPSSFQTTAKGGRQPSRPRRVAMYADSVWLNRHGRAVNRQHDTLDDHPHHA
jgi:archaetidylinositol phosphate synthase